MSAKVKTAIIGSGNIDTDLMIKIVRSSDILEMAAFVGIDPGIRGPQAGRAFRRRDYRRGH